MGNFKKVPSQELEMRHLQFTRTIAAAHRLTGTSEAVGLCNNIHGHNYQLEITIITDELSKGFAVPWDSVKKLIDEYDHSLILKRDDPLAAYLHSGPVKLRMQLIDEEPTTEVLASVFAERIAECALTDNARANYAGVTVLLVETGSIAAIGECTIARQTALTATAEFLQTIQ
jgi:6-pyruvoyl-tetrahydropterin synthase